MATILDELAAAAEEGRRSLLRPDVLRTKLKEKLQLYALDFIYNDARYNHLILYGGTCLRKCFSLGRMSEDIDFEALADLDKKTMAEHVKEHFNKKLLCNDVEISVPGAHGVSRIELKFAVMNKLGLSLHAQEKLILKIEINNIDKTYPTEHQTISEDRFSFVVKRYDLPTLMASKMTACLERVWKRGGTGIVIKGRDFYDLIWYMQKQIIPDAERLKNAKGSYTIKTAFEGLVEKISKITKRDLTYDLEPLFEDGRFIEIWADQFHEVFNRLKTFYFTLT